MSGILAPVAFSPRCQGALQYAEKLACSFHSELTLLHVIPPPLGVYTAPESGAYSTAIELTEERMEQGKAELATYPEVLCPGVAVTRTVVPGDPAHEIVRCAESQGASLIVMATRGYGPFRRFLLGSVTAKVLHDAPCSVWTGPHLEQAPTYEKIAFHRVLCAIDLGDASRSVLQWAGRFAQEFDAPLDILHVLPHTLIQLGGMYFDPEWRAHAVGEVREQIARLQQDAHTAGEVLIEFGDTPASVSDVARNRKADVLVIGRGRDSGLAGRLRSTAYGILCQSPCPVAAV
jgi:nucleotide-binding universal stress UspA family protein